MSRKISRHGLCEGVVGCEQSACAEGFVQPRREERYLFFSFAWKLFG